MTPQKGNPAAEPLCQSAESFGFRPFEHLVGSVKTPLTPNPETLNLLVIRTGLFEVYYAINVQLGLLYDVGGEGQRPEHI